MTVIVIQWLVQQIIDVTLGINKSYIYWLSLGNTLSSGSTAQQKEKVATPAVACSKHFKVNSS